MSDRANDSTAAPAEAGSGVAAPGLRSAPGRRRRSMAFADLLRVGLTVLAAVVLALLTIVTFLHLPRHQLPGTSVLPNADFREGFAGWQIEGLISLDEVEVGLAILQNHDPAKAAFLRRTIELPPGRTHLRLAADVAAIGVERGEAPWQAARIYLVQEAPDGSQLWNQPFLMVSLVGTTSRQHYERIFEVPSTIPRVVLGIELPYAIGRLEVAGLMLEEVEERPSFRLIATLLVCSWSLLALWVVVGVYRSIRSATVRFWLLVSVAVLVAGVFMPALLRAHLIRALAQGFGFALPSPDAFGHALVFGLLALLVRSGRPRDPILLHLSCWLLLGAVTEVLQLMTPDRDPEAGDWAMDALGVALGLAVAELGWKVQRWLEAARKRRRRKSMAGRAALEPE
jgi:hypothetical protein